MEESVKPESYIRSMKLGYKLGMLVFVSLLVLGVFSLGASYFKYVLGMDEYYVDTASRFTVMMSNAIDGDFLEELYQVVKTEEFQNIREKAAQTKDDAEIVAYLKEKNLYERYQEMAALLARMAGDSMKVRGVYLYVMEENQKVYLFHADADYLKVGMTAMIEKEAEGKNGNIHQNPYILYTEEECFAYSYEPVYNSRKEAVAVMHLQMEMNTVAVDQKRFLVSMSFIMVVLILLVAVFAIVWIRKTAVIPIEKITKSVVAFDHHKSKEEQREILELDIHTGNEIEELSHEINFMQKSILDYIENLEQVTAERERVGTELSIATQIQNAMLPNLFPDFVNVKEYDLYATMNPAREVGGDFYDFFMIDKKHLAILIADVSDKGVGAALFMAIAKSLIKMRAQTNAGSSPSEVLSEVDQRISENNSTGMFVTVWLGMVDLETGHIVACNAGHDYPAIMHIGEEFVIEKTPHGPPVAFLPGIPFQEITFDLKPGERLFLYTDGLIEAKRADGERFGIERMRKVLNAHRTENNEILLKTMKAEVDAFAGSEPQFDDMTMVGFTYRGSQ